MNEPQTEPQAEVAIAEERADGLRLLRRIVVILCVVVAANVLAAGASFLRVGAAVEDNCLRIHRVVETLDVILASGEEQTQKYVEEGLLTEEQAHRADRYREKQRRVLSTADCKP